MYLVHNASANIFKHQLSLNGWCHHYHCGCLLVLGPLPRTKYKLGWPRRWSHFKIPSWQGNKHISIGLTGKPASNSTIMGTRCQPHAINCTTMISLGTPCQPQFQALRWCGEYHTSHPWIWSWCPLGWPNLEGQVSGKRCSPGMECKHKRPGPGSGVIVRALMSFPYQHTAHIFHGENHLEVTTKTSFV